MRIFGTALATAVVACAAGAQAYMVETEFVRWTLDDSGCTTSFTDLSTGASQAAPAPTPFCSIRIGDAVHGVSRIDGDGDALRLGFGETGIDAVVRVNKRPRYFIITVVALNGGPVDEMMILNLPLVISGGADASFAVCALALNLQTRVPDIPGPCGHLKAFAYKRFGIEGASVAVVAAPAPELRNVMKEVVGEAEGLPRHRDASYPPIGGPWALDASVNRGSYLFDFGSLTEQNVDRWIDLLEQLGFNQIDFHTGASLRFGDYTPNPKLFPKGRASVKAVIDRLHDAGIVAGLHTYAFFIAKDSPYVTPVPDPRLGKDAAYTLTADIDETAAVVPVAESTADVSLATGFFARNSVTLQIGDEMVVFSGVSKEPPYGFTDCARGAHGTRAAAHAAGAPVYKLKECFGLFAPDADSTLLTEIAANTAEVFNECGFDMIYLDALDGEGVLAGNEYGWHYGAKFTWDIANRLDRPALFEMSTFHHHLWYVRARMGAWDHPTRAHKRFIDAHAAANAAGASMFLPMNLGWWAVKTWQDGTAAVWAEPTYPDDIEYLLGKALGNDMSLSLMGVNPDNIGKTPAYQRLLPLFRAYEKLRHGGVVTESVKALLRAPGDEFMLEQDKDGEWRFRPVDYIRHKVDSPDPWNASWEAHNRFGEQPVRLRIEALMSATPYEAEDAVVLEDFSNPDDFALRKTAPGVEASLEKGKTLANVDEVGARFAAANRGGAAPGAWAQIGRAYSPGMNIKDKPALGVWVHGDGSGALLNLQLLSARYTGAGAVGDHYITLDFTGRRYFTLVEFESERVMALGWPYGDHYSVYREHLDFAAVESFSLWFNNVPPGGAAECLIGPVKALPLVETPVMRPVVTVNGERIVFPVEIPVGACLEFQDASTCRLYGKQGELIAEVTPEGDAPLLREGKNDIAFSCDAEGDAAPRARVTVIVIGDSFAAS